MAKVSKGKIRNKRSKIKTSKNELKKEYKGISSTLNEKSKRLWCAAKARAIGKGGVALVHEVTGVSRPTIYAGIIEIEGKPLRKGKRRRQKKSDGRIRKKGGGAKTIASKKPSILSAIEAIIESSTKGDPEAVLRWVSKSSRKIQKELNKQGIKVCHSTVRTLLKQLGYSLQLNKKEKEGGSVPDRNAQFHHINDKAKAFINAGEPVISVDTKKKELIGEFKNNGREYRKKGEPVEVNVHDFPDQKEGKVAPYGVYDIGKNKGWVSVGITSDTAEFAANTIRSWWIKMGKKDHPKATKLMITADCGGSNGNKVRLWKWELQQIANEFDIEIHVCHFPPGTSKWNKIEHRMFSYITQNWRGTPLITREAVVQLIGNTKTEKGLKIEAQLDFRQYIPGKEVSDTDFNTIAIAKDEFHGEWNYVISPVIAFKIEK